MPGPLFHKFVTAMRQGAQKPDRNFCARKTAKRRKTHPIQPEKGETGCVLGAGGDGNGWEQVRTDGKNRKSRRKSWDGLSLACRLGCCSLVGSAQHRPGREPRPVRGGAPLAFAHPTARGFGVDVGIRQREPWRTEFKLSFSQNHKRAVLVWCSQDGARRVPKPRLI